MSDNGGRAHSNDERPATLIAELTYRCVLRCPYCSNPTDCGDARYRRELETEEWVRVFHEARRLGVLQLGLTGGEPLLRRDIVELAAGARAAGLYSTLVTAATPLPRERLIELRDAGLDHVQVSIQDATPEESDRIGGTPGAFPKKIEAARTAKELGFPLTLNFVLHRHNLDRLGGMLALAEELDADRVELANTQYYGWGLHNRDALMPTREQVERSRDVFEDARLRLGSRMDLLYVIPDYFEEFPKPCMGGWGRRAIVMAPNGDAMPCQAAASIPDLTFPNVRDHSLDWIWWESETFNRFRGFEWMQEPCRSCARRDLDYGGCRCQALLLTGDARATDPVCSLSPLHDIVVQARENPELRPLVPLEYRSMKGTALSR